MEQFLIVLSLWLHALATATLIGYFILSSLIFLPILTSTELDASGRNAVREISRRSRKWMYLSLFIFFLTGIILMLVDPNYRGVGDFGNPWAILILVKHVLVLVMLGLGFWFNAVLRVGPMLQSNSAAGQAVRRYRIYSYSMAVSGVLILFMTALAQADI